VEPSEEKLAGISCVRNRPERAEKLAIGSPFRKTRTDAFPSRKRA
jgi:hypothetical protein